MRHVFHDVDNVARQGTRLGRVGHVRVDRDDDGRIWVGGPVATVVEGHIVDPGGR